MVSAPRSSLKLSTFTTFSAAGEVAHFWMALIGAFLVTGTNINRDFFLNENAADRVCLADNGLPSVTTMTSFFASLLPSLISASAIDSAADVSVEALNHSAESIAATILSVSVDQCVSHLIPQSFTKSVAEPSMHLRYTSQVLGPLNSNTEICAASSPVLKALTMVLPTSTVAFQPFSPILPLASKRRITSSIVLHFKIPSAAFASQNIVLHFFRSNRSSPSSSGHSPAPKAASATSFTLTVLPTSHSLEQFDQGDQSDRTQSLSHDWVLQGSLSLVAPHASPPCAGCLRIPRTRCFTPPPQSALHALQPVQSSRMQSTGQTKSLQVLDPSSGGHFIPISAATNTVR